MKTKILSTLETKFKSLGLGKQTLEGVAEYLSKTIKEESEIGTAVDNSAHLLTIFQKETDRRVTGLETELEGLKKKTGDQKLPVTTTATPADEIPAYLKPLMETVKNLADELNQQKVQNKVSATKESALGIMLSKGIEKSLCVKILERITPGEKDTADTLAETGIAEYNDFTRLMVPGGKPPENSQGMGSDNVLKDYFAEKKKEVENFKKVTENA
jgi:hypothetical protein